MIRIILMESNGQWTWMLRWRGDGVASDWWPFNHSSSSVDLVISSLYYTIPSHSVHCYHHSKSFNSLSSSLRVIQLIIINCPSHSISWICHNSLYHEYIIIHDHSIWCIVAMVTKTCALWLRPFKDEDQRHFRRLRRIRSARCLWKWGVSIGGYPLKWMMFGEIPNKNHGWWAGVVPILGNHHMGL